MEGEHSVYLYLSDLPVPTCPVQGWAEPGMGPSHVTPLGAPPVVAVAATTAASAGARQGAAPPPPAAPAAGGGGGGIVLRGDGLRVARTREETEFVIDGSEVGAGTPSCALLGSKADVPVHVDHLGNNVWRATYIPLIPGKVWLSNVF